MKRAAKLTTMAMKPKKNSSKLSESKNGIVNSDVSSNSKPLLSLAQLYQGVVVRRPSQHNKSPYVADVTLDEGFRYSTVNCKKIAYFLNWNSLPSKII
jgi:hypothetical protein